MLIFKEPVADKALPEHVITTKQVPDERSCRVKCYMEPNCVSINVGPGTEEQLTCELNNHTDESPSHFSLEERKRYTHYAVENFCHGDPCPEKISVCQVGFTNRGYRCACRDGYITTGDHDQCEDIDECSMPDYGHCSPNADCINQPGSFECKCKSGYTGDGVKCDGLTQVYITSGGFDDPAESVIKVDGTDHSLKQRGHNVVAIKQKGRVIEAASFDTHADVLAGKNMKDWINGLPNHTVVLMSVYDSGENSVDDAADALRSLGARQPLKPTFRASWLLVGYKGTGKRPSWIRQAWKQRYQGPSSVSVAVLL